jgi:very-short-patch-repair endonuclease
LCSKCLAETQALWSGETKKIERQIEEDIEYWTRRHGINKYADANRTAYENLLDLLANHCVTFNGDNLKASGGRDLTTLELIARRIIHDEFKINCEEQIILYSSYFPRGYTVDGLIGDNLVLEYDGYYHSRSDQKDRDSHRDFMLTEYGKYKVLRFSKDEINNDKSGFKTRILDGILDIKQRKPKVSLPAQIPASPTSN